MKFSENWLRTFVDPPADRAELARRLTMAGLEVESIEPIGHGLDNRHHDGIPKLLVGLRIGNRDFERLLPLAVEPHQPGAFSRC
jgi:hypothetical protein